jgi:hypothetical protein
MVTRVQLLACGFTSDAIDHRIEKGRLHPIWPGVYSVGWPDPDRYGMFMGAVLCGGAGAVLSHMSAAALWGLLPDRQRDIHITVPGSSFPRRRGIVVHRRGGLAGEVTTLRHDIPVTSPISTIVDLATCLDLGALETVVNEADVRGLASVADLREAIAAMGQRPGTAGLRRLIDRRTFRLTRSQLERRFIPIALRAGLPMPLTRVYVNGVEVDFWFPDLGLVVETDGGRFHRTPSQQTKDRRRDQLHTAAGLTALRFTHEQISFEPREVEAILGAVALRLG